MPTLNKFPYFSQLDNKYNPYGSCNVTSLAMCLYFLGIRGDGSQKQLEDEIYLKLLDQGLNRQDPYDLQLIANSYQGITDNFTATGSIDDIKESIIRNQPCIIHGYFTRSGHIITVIGFNEKGLIVNDPYGEYYVDGYDRTARGQELVYSYGLISLVCSPESVSENKNIWLHRISRN
jgi:uncharacterized protein YvpB